jgi:peroxiredoxin
VQTSQQPSRGKLVDLPTKDKVGVGSKAPDFTLLPQMGEMVSLADFLGKKPIALIFYPKDDTLGCTKQARAMCPLQKQPH